MFKFGNEEYTDQEAGMAIWNELKALKEKCHELAVDYVKNNPRDPYYKLTYTVDPGEEVVYTKFTDEELKALKKAYQYEDGDEPYECLEDRLYDLHKDAPEMDIDFTEHIPEDDWHWAGGYPVVEAVDLENPRKYCGFQLVVMKNDSEEPVMDTIALPLDDEQWTRLLELCIFDKDLTFNDLKVVMPEVHEVCNELLHVDHHDFMVRMPEVTRVAKELGKDLAERAEIEKLKDNIFGGLIVHHMLEDSEQYEADDKDLWNRFKLLM